MRGRMATLVATAAQLEATATDDALELLELLMATELVGTARQEADKETVKRHPRLARASATLAVVAEALLQAREWPGRLACSAAPRCRRSRRVPGVCPCLGPMRECRGVAWRLCASGNGDVAMRNGRSRRSVPRTAMGTVGGRRTGGSSSKRGGSGLSGFRITRNTPRPSWGGWGKKSK